MSLLERSFSLLSDLKVPSPPGLVYYPHQLACLEYIMEAGRAVLIADPPGAGKTIVVAGYMNLVKPKKTLIVCPATLTQNWRNELSKWLTHHVHFCRYIKGTQEIQPCAEVVLVSYDLSKCSAIAKWVEKGVDLLCADESHYLKNGKALRTINVLHKLSAKAQKILLMSGTPMVNRPVELYAPTKALCPKAIDHMTFMNYVYTYCSAKHDGYGLNVNGYSNMKELGLRLRSHWMIRREKNRILPFLPDKVRNIITVTPTKTAAKLIARENKLFDVKDIMKLSTTSLGIEGMSESRRLLGMEKIPFAIEYLKDQIEERKKVICFFHHQAVGAELRGAFASSCAYISGATPANQRQAQVERFQSDPACTIFIGSVSASGVGITLTKASYVCFVEFSWVSGENEQAEDRAHRIGQKNNVTVDYLVFTGSLDQNILKAQTIKSEQIRKTMTAVVVNKPINKENEEVTNEQIDQVVQAALAAANKNFANLLRAMADKTEAAFDRAVGLEKAPPVALVPPADVAVEEAPEEAAATPKGRGRPRKNAAPAPAEVVPEPVSGDFDFMEAPPPKANAVVTHESVKEKIMGALAGFEKNNAQIAKTKIQEALAGHGAKKISDLNVDALYLFNTQVDETLADLGATDDFM